MVLRIKWSLVYEDFKSSKFLLMRIIVSSSLLYNSSYHYDIRMIMLFEMARFVLEMKKFELIMLFPRILEKLVLLRRKSKRWGRCKQSASLQLCWALSRSKEWIFLPSLLRVEFPIEMKNKLNSILNDWLSWIKCQ